MRYVYVVTYRATVRATQNAAKAADMAMGYAGEPSNPRRRDQLARRMRQALTVRLPSSPPVVAEKVELE